MLYISYIKWRTIYQLHKKTRKFTKKTREKYQNMSEEEKAKKWQYGCKRYKKKIG